MQLRTRTSIAGLFVLGAGVTAWTQQTSANGRDIVQQATRYFYQAREGDFGVVPKVVSLLEDATAADPNDSALWRVLGTSYFLQATAASRAGKGVTELLPAFQRAAGAFERAVRIDPQDADALGGHGMALTILSGLERKPELLSTGTAEMNRAVEMSPSKAGPRLLRAFTTVNFPLPLRNNAALIEDLAFLIQVAEGSRAGDVLHILLGDVYAETGDAGQARRHYQTAGEQAVSRLNALERGSLPVGEMQRLRSSLGRDCMMCHAK
jgi:tetratricopeptide (TPR) repeat protein